MICPCGYDKECGVHCGNGHTTGKCPPLTKAYKSYRRKQSGETSDGTQDLSESYDNPSPSSSNTLDSLMTDIESAVLFNKFNGDQSNEFRKRFESIISAEVEKADRAARIDEVSGVRGWTDYDPNPMYCKERFHVVPYSYLTERVKALTPPAQKGGK